MTGIRYPRRLITARKRSLGQGNIFTRVSFCPRGGACVVAGGCMVGGRAWLRGVWLWGACMVVGGGMRGCRGGA